MKKILLSLLFSLSLGAETLEGLDRRQNQLGIVYRQLQEQLPSPIELTLLAQNGQSNGTLIKSMNKIRAFFADYDNFNLEKIDFFHDMVLKRALSEARLYEENFGSLPFEARKQLSLLKATRSTYLERKIYFGTPKDTLRLDVAHQVLPAYANFAKAIRKKRGEFVWRNFGDAKIVPFIDSPKDFLKTSDQFMRLLWASYVKNRSGQADRAPIPEALAGVQRRLVKMRGIETAWEGMENLGEVAHDGETLHMFLINHANSFFDTSAQQSFPIKGISAMGDMEVIFPDFLSRRIVKSDHMIAVGHGDTTGKTIELVKKKQLNRFFLAIEGLTGSGLYEMRPVMPTFNDAVYEAIERGLKLKLHPVAFPDNFRLMNDWRAPIEGEKVARGVLLPAIDNAACLGLKQITGSKDSIGMLIRWYWFETLNNAEEEVLSMRYPSDIERDFERMIWGND
jgi:hypothetical protein